MRTELPDPTWPVVHECMRKSFFLPCCLEEQRSSIQHHRIFRKTCNVFIKRTLRFVFSIQRSSAVLCYAPGAIGVEPPELQHLLNCCCCTAPETGSMNSLVLLSVLLVLFIFSLVTSILQAVTLRLVRSASRQQKLDSPTQGRDSTIEGTCSDGATDAGEYSSIVQDRIHRRTQRKSLFSEFSTGEKDRPVHRTTRPTYPVSDRRWQWLSYVKLQTKHGEIEVKHRDQSEDAAHTEDGPFKVYYLKRIHISWPDVVEVLVTSPPLIEILQRCLPDHDELKVLDKPKVSGRNLYTVLRTLKRHARPKSSRSDHRRNNDLPHNGSQPADGGSHGAEVGEGVTKEPGMDIHDEAASGILHAQHLVRFLEKEYKDVLKKEEHMRQTKQVAWDMLWTFLPKGAKVCYYCSQSEELLCAEVDGAHYRYDMKVKVWTFFVQLKVRDFDGTRYKTCLILRSIDEFPQERQFSQLAVYPIDILENSSYLEDKFLANGRKFSELIMETSNQFMLYKGPMYHKRRSRDVRAWDIYKDWDIYKQKGDGRVMIDLCSFAAMNPDYPMDNARPPLTSSLSFRGGHVQNQEDVSDGTLIFAPAVVYGFSFKLKKWGCFAVSGFLDIVFDKGAFEELTMEPKMKSLVYNLVRQYVSSSNDPEESSERVDPIAEKGEGYIVLCHGPPGTGKTLTAESVAENLERPLWAMSVAELGTTPSELETKLLKILDIAARWKAVLLLDEADIYLEERTSLEKVVRNAMTGVFLRELEYCRGILFLTTNRIGRFDKAFQSRISLFLRYPELRLAEKEKIWKTLLRRAKVDKVTDEFCKEMAGENLNGRQIRNAIHTAQVLAVSKEEGLAVRHVKYAMKVLANSLMDLNQEVLTTPG